MRVVLTGASGQLGSYLLQELIRAGHRVSPWSRGAAGERCGLKLRPVNLIDGAGVEAALESSDPEVVIHAAAVSTAEVVRKDPAAGWAVNVEGTRRLADWCERHARRLVFTSTDLVFDGTGAWYREDDAPVPIMAYGRTKAEAERAVLAMPAGTVARLSLLYGPNSSGRESFFDRALASLRAGKEQWFFLDEYRTPLDYRTAARALVGLAEGAAEGVVHVAGKEGVSRFELLSRVAAVMGIDASLVKGNRRDDVVFAEPRPADVSLDTTRLATLLPGLDRPSIEQAVVTA